MANSCVDSLPNTMAPAPRSRATHTASAVAILSIKILEWHVVGRPATSMMSLMPTGTPCSGPRRQPAAISASAALAASIAASPSRRMNTCSFGSRRSIRSSSAVINSTGESFRPAMARAASDAESQWRSLTARLRCASAARVRRADRSAPSSWLRRRSPVQRRRQRLRGIPPAPCPARRAAPAVLLSPSLRNSRCPSTPHFRLDRSKVAISRGG
jgi:hypothetical protein